MTASEDPTLELPFGRRASRDGDDEPAPLSVSELVGQVAETLEHSFAEVLVAGEISKLSRPQSGHLYFTLSDEDARIDGVMWRRDSARLGFEPAVGDEVVCRGRIGVYPPQGRMQLYASSLRPLGWGAAQRALEQLKRKLAAEGLFDERRKRPLPLLPRCIGVVTSASGAAVHDVLSTIRRRFRHCRVLISPALVQGEDAPASLVTALALLAEEGSAEVVIVGRGGGASEDLMAFNDEAVVRAVASFPAPVVSAVGHEVDVTLCDLAADRRAATPTAAAELVVPVYGELLEQVTELRARLRQGVVARLRHARLRVDAARGRLREPLRRVMTERQRIDEVAVRLQNALRDRGAVEADRLTGLSGRLDRAALTRPRTDASRLTRLDGRLRRASLVGLSRATTSLATLRAKLDALSPLAVLDRGYSLAARADGALIRSATEIEIDDRLTLRFARGRASVRVETKTDGDD